MDPNEVVKARFPYAGDINIGSDFMQSPRGWGNALRAKGDLSPYNPANMLPPPQEMIMPRPDPRRQPQNNIFPATPTGALADPAMNALFQAPVSQPRGTQLAGDVVPLPIRPTAPVVGLSPQSNTASRTEISDYNRLNGLLKALRAERAGTVLPSASIHLGPGAAP